MTPQEYLKSYGVNAKNAVNSLANSAVALRNEVLHKLCELIEKEKRAIFVENNKDLLHAKEKGLSNAMIDRLKLNEMRISEMILGLKQLVDLEEFSNKIVNTYIREDGMKIQKILVPLGVIGIIYESRPNVTVDAAGLCIKSGNVCILRGGSEAINSNRILSRLIRQALKVCKLDENSVQLIDDTNREIASELMKSRSFLDLLIPRGGSSLIKSVTQNATVPVIETGAGNCHIYVEKEANYEMAIKIIINAKIQKPSVCNAVEKILVDRSIAKEFIPLLVEKLINAGVEVRGCEESVALCNEVLLANEDDWHKEYNDLILAIKVVSGISEALTRIEKYSTKHSEAIITENAMQASAFMQAVDSSAVYHNVSTRFSDGFEFGMGAEIGISTQKLHARGPMGLRELYTTKYIVTGNGQVRK